MPRIDQREALKVVESLRTGVPPKGHVREFTVGRKGEVESLERALKEDGSGSLLLVANYGAGKSHLLRFVEETALAQGYAVSFVTVAAQGAVRFNRMDQVIGAIWRGVELPNAPAGPRGFLDAVTAWAERAKTVPSDNRYWAQLTADWQWDYSQVLAAPSLFVAIRAWATGEPSAQDLVEDFLRQPWVYKSQRRRMYERLIVGLRPYFRDPRPDWHFYKDGVFDLAVGGYTQAWAMLRDLSDLVQAMGMRGLVLLFDEYEDVVTNMNNIAHQQSAFWNLFQFFRGVDFKGRGFFAVTPQFRQKCKDLLIRRWIVDYDFEQFDRLPHFEMSPITREDMLALGHRIADVHGSAYRWPAGEQLANGSLRSAIDTAFRVALEDRTRRAIVEVVKALDAHLADRE